MHPSSQPKYNFCVHFYRGETMISHLINKIRSSATQFFYIHQFRRSISLCQGKPIMVTECQRLSKLHRPSRHIFVVDFPPGHMVFSNFQACRQVLHCGCDEGVRDGTYRGICAPRKVPVIEKGLPSERRASLRNLWWPRAELNHRHKDFQSRRDNKPPINSHTQPQRNQRVGV